MINTEIDQITSNLSKCNINSPNYKKLYLKKKKKFKEKNKRIKELLDQINELKQIIDIQNKYIVASKTAKNGFKEEDLVVNDLNNNKELKQNLEKFLNSELKNFAKKTGTTKTDITDGKIRIQVKKHKKDQFGQVDRHYLSYFLDKIPKLKSIEKYLSGICELPLLDNGYCDKSKSIIKLTKSNYSQQELENLIKILNQNKKEIIEYAFIGYNTDSKPNLLCGSEYTKDKKREKLIFYKMNDVIKYLNTQNFKIRKSGTVIELGNSFTIQRKGGDKGKKQANHLQIKLIFSNLEINEKLEFYVKNY